MQSPDSKPDDGRTWAGQAGVCLRLRRRQRVWIGVRRVDSRCQPVLLPTCGIGACIRLVRKAGLRPMVAGGSHWPDLELRGRVPRRGWTLMVLERSRPPRGHQTPRLPGRGHPNPIPISRAGSRCPRSPSRRPDAGRRTPDEYNHREWLICVMPDLEGIEFCPVGGSSTPERSSV
jgi:hypothetical protein